MLMHAPALLTICARTEAAAVKTLDKANLWVMNSCNGGYSCEQLACRGKVTSIVNLTMEMVLVHDSGAKNESPCEAGGLGESFIANLDKS
jgi:hypothetical protein